MAAASASLTRYPSNRTVEVEEAESDVDDDTVTFELSGPVVRFHFKNEDTYLFLRLVATEENGTTYILPFYKSSGKQSGFSDLWFPCKEVEANEHIVKGTPSNVPKFFPSESVRRDESFLYRVPSRLGLLGMAALNTMSVEGYTRFSKKLMSEAHGIDEVENVLRAAKPLFMNPSSELKMSLAAAMEMIRDIASRETLNRFLEGGEMVGGRRPTKKSKNPRKHKTLRKNRRTKTRRISRKRHAA